MCRLQAESEARSGYGRVLDALSNILAACMERGEPILGINFGEADFAVAHRRRIRQIINDHEVPWYYFSPSMKWKVSHATLPTVLMSHAVPTYMPRPRTRYLIKRS